MVISCTPKWTQRTVAGNTRLLSVHREGVGYDMVDVPALSRAGIIFTINASPVRRPMATVNILFILALSLRMPTMMRLAKEGKWAERSNYLGIGLVGRTLGSIGVGGIGKEMFRLAKPFAMKHIAITKSMSQEAVNEVGVALVDMDTLLRESDFLTINCPLNKETYHLIGEAELRKMKRTAFLINTARGPIVDEKALIKALREAWIQGAALDVFEQEPTPVTNPLLHMENVIATPHYLCNTDQCLLDEWDTLVSQVTRVMQGQPPDGLLNREVWDSQQFQDKLRRFRQSIL
jgi:D-3-phosphoglycerate dehydrogenase